MSKKISRIVTIQLKLKGTPEDIDNLGSCMGKSIVELYLMQDTPLVDWQWIPDEVWRKTQKAREGGTK